MPTKSCKTSNLNTCISNSESMVGLYKQKDGCRLKRLVQLEGPTQDLHFSLEEAF